MHAYSGSSWNSAGRLRDEVGEVEADRTDALAHAVHERDECVQRTAVRRAECDDLAGHLVAAEHVDVVARDEPTHRVTDEHEPGIGISRPASEAFEHRLDRLLQHARVVPVRQAPVVRELHEVDDTIRVARIGLDDVERLAEPREQAFVADGDRPDAGHDVHVGHERGCGDAVAGMVVADAVRELQALDRFAATQQVLQDRPRRELPYVVTVRVAQHAAHDPGEHDDDIAELFGHRGLLRS